MEVVDEGWRWRGWRKEEVKMEVEKAGGRRVVAKEVVKALV